MAYPVRKLCLELNAPLADMDILAERCVIAGLPEAIDVSFFDASMVEDILGPEAARLGGVLLEGALRARPMIKGWVTAID